MSASPADAMCKQCLSKQSVACVVSASSTCGTCDVCCVLEEHCYKQSSAHADVHYHLHCAMRPDIQTSVCLCLCVLCVICMCCIFTCIFACLAWPLEPIIMKMLSVQVSLSPLVMLRAFKGCMTLCRSSVANWWSCCFPAIAPLHPTELAMMSTHRRAAAGDTLCCRSSSCLYAMHLTAGKLQRDDAASGIQRQQRRQSASFRSDPRLHEATASCSLEILVAMSQHQGKIYKDSL